MVRVVTGIRYLLLSLLSLPVVVAVSLAQGGPGDQHILKNWEITGPIPGAQIDLIELDYPNFVTLNSMQWQTVSAVGSGLVDISRYIEPGGQGPDVIIARTTLKSDSLQQVRLTFDHSGEIAVYINKKKIFCGGNYAGSRDRPLSTGPRQYDHIYVTINRGLNEVFLLLKEVPEYGGFTLLVDREFGELEHRHDRLEKVWETPAEFMIPESVLYDPGRDILYVSSYNRTTAAGANHGFISKVSTEGEILDLEWVKGLDGPCGMGLAGDRLYVVECTGNLVEIDSGSGTILNRYRAPGSRFLNDMVVDSDGSIYVSDTSPPLGYTSLIYRFSGGGFEVWKEGMEIQRANGLFIHEGRLIVGSSGDCLLKAVDLKTKLVTDIIGLGGRVIDGIRVDNEGNYLVTLWEGEAVLVSESGELVEILNTRGTELNLADIEFIKEKNLMLVPTFYGNRVVAYRLR